MDIISLLVYFFLGQAIAVPDPDPKYTIPITNPTWIPVPTPHGAPSYNPTPAYYYSGSQSSPSPPPCGGSSSGLPYYARQMGMSPTYVSDNAWIASANFKYIPPAPYVHPPYVSPPEVLSLRAAKVRLQNLVEKRNEAKERIAHMDYAETRREMVTQATESLKVAKEYYLADDYESGDIASNISDVLLDIATSVTPVVSWMRDTYEAIIGKDLHTGEELSSFARSMAVLGAVTAGYGSKVGKAIAVFEKTMKISDQLKAAGKIVDPARELLYSKPIAELKETIGFLRKYKFYGDTSDEMAVSLSNAFLKSAKREVVQGEISVVRYSQGGTKGYWVTTQELADPHSTLALLHNDPVKISRHTIKEGAEILRGYAAPQKKVEKGIVIFDRPGGAEQILVDTKFLE